MTGDPGRPTRAALRERAEEALRATRRDVAALRKEGVQRLVHELQVHQIELETQNEELRVRTRELEEARSQYQELYDFAPAGYVDLDSSGVIRRANLAAASLLDLDRQRLVGRPFSEFVDAADVPALHDHLRSTASNARASCELRLSKPRDPAYVLLVTQRSTSPTAGHLMALTDITERRRAQEALGNLNRELEQRVASRTAELAERNRRLEEEMAARAKAEDARRRLEERLRAAERLESLGLLAGGIAHDFNNILVGVLANADLLLQKTPLSEDARESVTLIKRAARSAADLTRQMLLYARQSQLKLEPIALHAVIRDSLQLLRASSPRSAEIRTELGEELLPIEADRGQVQQVVTNLLTNALDALGEGNGTVVVRTHVEDLDAEDLATYAHATGAQAGRFVVLTVTDTGRGIDAAVLSRIFDPFFTTKSTGRGLGLASVLGILQGHHGAVRVRSEPGHGTTFDVAWPVSSTRAEPSGPPVPEAEWRGSGRVLLVDDDASVRQVVARQLAFLGFDVVAASDGEAGLRLVREAPSPFTLVVLDRTMPGLSGDQVLTILREEAPDLPIVLMSGWSVDDPKLAGEAVAFLQKPMTLAELVAAVRKVLEAATSLGNRPH